MSGVWPRGARSIILALTGLKDGPAKAEECGAAIKNPRASGSARLTSRRSLLSG